MSCLFVDKLAPELREKIYRHVLDYENAPLRHATQLQPFVKKLTGADGELPFAYEDPTKRDPELDWIACDEELGISSPINTAILSTCKTIYTEGKCRACYQEYIGIDTDLSLSLTAIKVFYDLNVISVDIELFKLANIISPAGSDLSLAKRLVITFNSSCNQEERHSREFNTIDLDNFFKRTKATFPTLLTADVLTDGTLLPSTSLFDIGQDCHMVPSIITSVGACNVGHLVAKTRPGYPKLTIMYKELVDWWRETTDASIRSKCTMNPPLVSIYGFPLSKLRVQNLTELVGVPSCVRKWRALSTQ